MYPSQWSALSRATAFDLPYSITYLGNTYKADSLANIKLRRSIEGKNFSGISTTEFSCDIYSEVPLMEGQAVSFNGYDLPAFYISAQTYKGGVASITAYDRCKNLDIPFDYSNYTQFNADGSAKWYSTSLIVSAIANQCGFTSGGYSGRMAQLCYNDFAGKSCRAILDDLSKVDVGHWQDSGGALVFVPFSVSSGLACPGTDSRTEIVRRGTKAITGIFAEDEIYGTEYSTGSSWTNTERLSGRYLSEMAVQQMAAQILGNGGEYDYHGWECSSLLTEYLYNIGDFISYGDELLPVLSADFSFTAQGITASLSAPEADGSFSEYHDLYSRKIENRVAYDRLLGCTTIGAAGLSFVCKKGAEVNSG